MAQTPTACGSWSLSTARTPNNTRQVCRRCTWKRTPDTDRTEHVNHVAPSQSMFSFVVTQPCWLARLTARCLGSCQGGRDRSSVHTTQGVVMTNSPLVKSIAPTSLPLIARFVWFHSHSSVTQPAHISGMRDCFFPGHASVSTDRLTVAGLVICWNSILNSTNNRRDAAGVKQRLELEVINRESVRTKSFVYLETTFVHCS